MHDKSDDHFNLRLAEYWYPRLQNIFSKNQRAYKYLMFDFELNFMYESTFLSDESACQVSILIFFLINGI